MCDHLLVTVAVLKSVNGHIFCKNVEKTTTKREQKVKNKEVIGDTSPEPGLICEIH